jgi:hypothetical protein
LWNNIKNKNTNKMFWRNGIWRNGILAKWHFGEMAIWRNGILAK